jgi:hypothetical protein
VRSIEVCDHRTIGSQNHIVSDKKKGSLGLSCPWYLQYRSVPRKICLQMLASEKERHGPPKESNIELINFVDPTIKQHWSIIRSILITQIIRGLDSHADGTMINVDFAAIRPSLKGSLPNIFPAYSLALPREPIIAHNMAKDLPSPISSAKMPPKKSVGIGLLAPVMMCW